jgi:hypothetical protein
MTRPRRRCGRWRISIITTIVAIAGFAVICGAAGAGELTRDEYVAKLESLCKPRVQEIERRVDGVRSDVHSGKLKIAGKKFGIAAKIFGRSVRENTPVPRPKEYRSQLKTWFRYLHQQEDYMLKISDAFGHEEGVKGQRDVSRFVHSGNLSNNTVFGWGFNYCSFKFSRYG